MLLRFLLLAALATGLAVAAPTTAATLGPAVDAGLPGGTAINGTSGSSTDASSLLQPAGTTPLQAVPSTSTGLAAPTDPLQAAPGAGSDVQALLQNEADGPPRQTAAASSSHALADILVALVAILLAGGLAWQAWWRRTKPAPPAQP
jgi:hypothetical protein